MLPLMNLFSPDLLKFDNALNNIEIMPEDAVDPEAAFGDFLAIELLELPQPEALSGQPLPLDGNALPPPLDGEAAGLPVLAPGGAVSPLAGAGEQLGALPAETPIKALPGVAPSIAEAQKGMPAVATTDPSQPVVTPNEPVSPLARSPYEPGERQQLAAPTSLPPPASRLQYAENAGGEPVMSREAQTGALARMSADDMSGRQQQSAEREALLARGNAQARQAQMEPVAPASFQAVREDAATELRGLQQLGQQLQQSQATQPVTQVAQSAQPTAPLTTHRPTADVPPLLNTPVTDPAWGAQIGDRVVMMAGKQLQNAEIRLSPAELGPLRIQIRVDDGAANVTFHAHHAVTRDAIEQAMPRLREMLAENGLNLGQTSVSEQGIGQQGQTERDADTNAGAGARYDAELDAKADTDLVSDFEPRRILDGLVDTFV